MSLNANRKRIVVAEDDPAIMELVSVRLDLAGYHVIAARNGYEALERVNATRPAALILDIGMPGLDGFGVLKELARRPVRLPTLVLTARRGTDDVREAIGLGATSYLVKPFDDKHLLNRLANMVTAPKVATKELPVSDGPDLAPKAGSEAVWEL